MGLAAQEVQSDVIVDGYPLEGTAYYVYCDRCGSFNVRSHLKAADWGTLISLLVITAAFLCYFTEIRYYPVGKQVGLWLAYGLIFCAVAAGLLTKYHSHRCLKCGNTDITYRDVLHYSEREDLNEVIDVPRSMLHWHDKPPDKPD